MFFSSWRKKPPPEETVAKGKYEAAVSVRDEVLAKNTLLAEEVQLLQEQIADLTGKYTALGVGGARVRGMAEKAIRLLERVSTTHRASPNFKREIDVLVAEARSAGLIEEKREQE